MSHKATMWAVTVRGISCAEARILWHLADCHNPVEGCFPSQEYLADACEIDVRSVRRHLDSLRGKGMINWAEQRDGKYRKNNRYALAFEEGFRPEEVKDQPDKLSGSENASTGQNPQFEPDKIDVLNRTLESSTYKPVIEPVTEPGERAGEREGLEDPKRVERDFKRWFPIWPTYVADSEREARKIWFELSSEDRADCLDRTPAYIAAVKATGRTKGWQAASVYLSTKGWQKLSDPKSDIAPPSVHNPFSRAWSALRLAELLKPMATAMPALTLYQRGQVAAGGDAARLVDRERREKYGWPKVNTMHQFAERAQGSTVPPDLVAISEGFGKVHRDSELACRWKALHERMGWPWLPNTGHEWLYFPPGEPEEAMIEFKTAVARERGHDDAA